MDRKPVVSSQITSIGYDPATKKLEIEFPGRGEKPGSVYEYDNVDQETHDGFFKPEADGSPRSIGRYFGQTIKSAPDKFPYRKLPPKG